MTTIAYDGKSLCADSQVTAGTVVFGATQKIHKLQSNSLFAMAGDLSLSPAIIDWLNGGAKPELSADENVHGLVVDLDTGEAMEISTKLRLFPACMPWAGGSGEAIAMTAMKLGKTARQAVEIACELDIYSRLPVQVCRITKKQKPTPQKH